MNVGSSQVSVQDFLVGVFSAVRLSSGLLAGLLSEPTFEDQEGNQKCG